MRIDDKFSATVAATLAGTLALLTGCLNDSGSKSRYHDGTAKVTVTVQNIGTLQKTAAIELKQLILKLHTQGQDTLFDTLPLSGMHMQTHNVEYNDLATNVNWTLTAHTVDSTGKMIHSGQTTFTIAPRGTANVSLSLAARYSILKAHFFPIRDSVTRVEMRVGTDTVARESFAKQSRLNDTVTLSYDYLPASEAGATHAIRLEAHGSMWGFDTLRYRADTAITVVSGQNATYNIELKWVGPALPPPGQANLSVTLGAVSGTTVNAHLEDTTPATWRVLGNALPFNSTTSSMLRTLNTTPYLAFADNESSFKASVMTWNGSSWSALGGMHINGSLLAATSFPKGSKSGDTVTLAYDYLAASPSGTLHTVRLDVRGDWYGTDTLMYRGDTVITAVSGQNRTYDLPLHWLGPSAPPPGTATINVALGARGAIQLNARLMDPEEATAP